MVVQSSHVFQLATVLTVLLIWDLSHKQISAEVVNTKLVFTEGIIAADNYPQRGILTNGQFPGPTIYVHQNDTLVITVVNNLSQSFSLHSHGILQKGTVRADGVPHVTQDPIPPNSTYIYTMHMREQSGTFMYHAHTDLDLVWAFGALIISDSSEVQQKLNYTEERIIFLSQCWHTSMQDILNGLTGSPFADVPDTSSILINGRSWGQWNDSRGLRADPYAMDIIESEGYTVIRVKQNETYRFRVTGLGLDSMLRFSIENHTSFEIIEVDGILTDSVQTDYLPLNSAQRYSIKIKMNQPIGNYWIIGEMLPGPGPTNGKAILHYEGAPEPTQMRTQLFTEESDEIELDNWILDKLHPSTTIDQPVAYPVPLKVDREIVIKSFQRVVDGHTKFDMNGIFHRNKGPTLLFELEAGKDIVADKENGVFEIFEGENVQIVFENRMSDEGECEQHPWHTHGHTFYVVGQGPDSYNSTVDGQAIDTRIKQGEQFLFRDVVTLFTNQKVENKTSGSPCGWTAIRFLADNPGLWLAHCHITPHLIMGKYLILYEHPANGSAKNSKQGTPSSEVLGYLVINTLFILMQ